MSALEKFVPHSKPVAAKVIEELQLLLNSTTNLLVITGAGVSTESGIPDYRSANVGQYARTKHRPIQHMEFMTNEYWRRRYWARNFLAYNRFSTAPCNTNHTKLAEWEKSNRFNFLITQNVDGLHTDAGSKKLVELHGCAKQVVCMSCKQKYSRSSIQKTLLEMNPNWKAKQIGELAPDGDIDAEISDNALANFQPPFCESCGERSILKTDVVFFGDNVSRNVVDLCYEKVESSDALFVFGSSLQVMSGYRFVHFAQKRMPVVIVSIGETRGDNLADLKINAKCSDVLSQLEFQ